MDFGIMVYNHEWIILCSISVQVKGQGHRLRVILESLENNVWSVSQSQMDQFDRILVWWCVTMSILVLFIKCLPSRSRSQVKGHSTEKY